MTSDETTRQAAILAVCTGNLCRSPVVEPAPSHGVGGVFTKSVAVLNALIFHCDARSVVPKGGHQIVVTGRQAAVVLYAFAMVAVVVVVDVVFFKNHFWPRLMSNVGIVLVFAAFYLRFLKRP
jgi:hypothetical protein